MNILAVPRLMVCAAIAVAASACGGDGPTPPLGGVASVLLSPATDIRLYAISETAQLTATPKDGSGNTVSAAVTFTSSNTGVATVGSTGLITATGIGTTKIVATAGSVSKDLTVTVQQAQFNVRSTESCANPDLRSYKFEAQSARLLIVSDPANPPNGFTAADYQEFAATFESLVWPVVTANFGVPADIDGNGKAIAFFTRAVNELTPTGSVSVTGGFFFGRDLFPKVAGGGFQACAGSNQAEMFYLLVPDPTGSVNGNVRTAANVKRITLGVIGHELQHLINSSRRLFINQGAMWPETAYMEEGLSHIAEEMVFYEASGGLAPKVNIGISAITQFGQPRVDAFNAYMASNAVRFSNYLRSPTTNAPTQADDDLETRGAIWSFLRYLADRGTPGTPFSETACTPPVTLAVGGRCRVDGAAGAQFNVSPGTTLGEYAIIAFAADLPVTGSLTATGSATSSIAVTGPPTPWAAPAGAQLSMFGSGSMGTGAATMTLDYTFHSRLRALERKELRSRVAGARAAYSMIDRSSARLNVGPGSAPSAAAIVVEPVWGQLVNSNDTGIVNLRGRFGADITGAQRDWAVANYVDDTSVPALPNQYMHPSWNFRSLLAGLPSNNNVYPLQVQSLTSPVTLTFTNGGAAYYRFGVPAGATSSVTFTSNGSAPPSNLKLVVVRTK